MAARYFSLLHYVQTGSEDVKLTTNLHPVPRLRTVELYLYSPYVLTEWCLVN
jgi:hypothetical protein